MPRRGKIRTRGRGSGRRNENSLKAKIVSVPFHRHTVGTLGAATGILTYTMTPQTIQIGALSEVGDQFDLFRFTKLEYRLHPFDPTDTTSQGCCYIPDIDTQTASTQQLSESPLCVVQTHFSGVPSAWMRVPRSQLKGMLDWYKCNADAGAAEFEAQGLLYLTGGLSDTVYFEVRGVCQFKNPVSTVIQMERTIARFERLGLVVRLPKKNCDLQEKCVGKTPA